MKRSRIYMSAMASWVTALVLGISLVAAEPDFTVLEGLDSLYLTNGRGFTGKASAVLEGRLIFQGETESGSVTYRFTKDEVERLDFAGTELVVLANDFYSQEKYAEAVAIMERLYRQRARFFAFMAADQVAWFQKLADAAYFAGDYYLSVGVARNVRPYMADEGIRQQLHDRELLAHYHLPLIEKTRYLAENWVARWEPYADSALGWYVLGQLAFDQGNPEEALWLCLKPIVFSSQLQTDYLGHAYALATASALLMEDMAQAEALLNEMKARGLNWPNEKQLEPFFSSYQSGITAQQENNQDP